MRKRRRPLFTLVFWRPGQRGRRLSLLGFALTLLAVATLPATVYAPPFPFTDVPPDHFAYGAIQRHYGAGIVRGTVRNLFQPNIPATRAETAVFLDRGLPRMAENFAGVVESIPLSTTRENPILVGSVKV